MRKIWRSSIPSFRSLVMTPLMLGMFLLMQVISKLGGSRRLFTLMGRGMQSPRLKTRAFKGYRPTRHDVFVCTYVRSGTNWTMQIAFQIAHRGGGEYEHIHDVVAWPEPPMPRIVDLRDDTPAREAPTGLRVIKTHLESDYVPYSPESRYIVVVRDPKEVFVSSYYFSAFMLPGSGMVSVDEWHAMFLSDAFPHGSWAEHLAGYWRWRNRDNVLMLTYGEMTRDLEGTVRRIARFMDVTLTDEEVALVVEKSSFAYMKRIDHRFTPALPFPLNRLARPVMVRSGKSGRSADMLTREQQAQIDRHMRVELRRRGLDVPYDEMFESVDEAAPAAGRNNQRGPGGDQVKRNGAATSPIAAQISHTRRRERNRGACRSPPTSSCRWRRNMMGRRSVSLRADGVTRLAWWHHQSAAVARHPCRGPFSGHHGMRGGVVFVTATAAPLRISRMIPSGDCGDRQADAALAGAPSGRDHGAGAGRFTAA